MSILLAVVGAFIAVTLTSHFANKSALSLGRVSAMISATAVIADAWSKVQGISKRLASNPTAVDLPSVPSQSSSSLVVTRPAVREEEDYYNENPSFGLTGGIRGYSAYRRP